MEFKAKYINEELVIEPIIVKDGDNVTVIVPTLDMITKFKQEDNNGKRNIQQI